MCPLRKCFTCDLFPVTSLASPQQSAPLTKTFVLFRQGPRRGMGRGNNEVALLLLLGSPVVLKLGSSDPSTPPESYAPAGFKQKFLHLFCTRRRNIQHCWCMLSCEALWVKVFICGVECICSGGRCMNALQEGVWDVAQVSFRHLALTAQKKYEKCWHKSQLLVLLTQCVYTYNTRQQLVREGIFDLVCFDCWRRLRTPIRVEDPCTWAANDEPCDFLPLKSTLRLSQTTALRI